MWEVEDGHLETFRGAFATEVGCGNVKRGGEGIEARDQELTNTSCSIEAGCEAGEDSGVKRVV